MQECDRYGAEIRYETEANADVIKAENPDVVILATGAEPIVLPVEGKETMIQANDVIERKSSDSRRKCSDYRRRNGWNRKRRNMCFIIPEERQEQLLSR